MTYNKLIESMTDQMTGNTLNNFIVLQNKDRGYATAIYYIGKYRDKIMNRPTAKAYADYFFWCDEQELPALSIRKFTTWLKGQRILIQQTRRNGEIVRIYTQADVCPTCNRVYN